MSARKKTRISMLFTVLVPETSRAGSLLSHPFSKPVRNGMRKYSSMMMNLDQWHRDSSRKNRTGRNECTTVKSLPWQPVRSSQEDVKVSAIRKLFNCGVYYHFLLTLLILTALKLPRRKAGSWVLAPTANKD
jgi:hypothetical protein